MTKFKTGQVREAAEKFISSEMAQINRIFYHMAVEHIDQLEQSNTWVNRIFRKHLIVEIPTVEKLVEDWISGFKTGEQIPGNAFGVLNCHSTDKVFRQIVQLSRLSSRQNDTFIELDDDVAETLSLVSDLTRF